MEKFGRRGAHEEGHMGGEAHEMGLVRAGHVLEKFGRGGAHEEGSMRGRHMKWGL